MPHIIKQASNTLQYRIRASPHYYYKKLQLRIK